MDIVTRINELARQTLAFCLATVVSSADDRIFPGAKAIIHQNGTMEGKTGDGETDELIRGIALEAYTRHKRELVTVKTGLTVFFDFISEGPRLVICGAGHIAVSLAKFAIEVGFVVTVIDDRPEFANHARFQGCRLIVDDFSMALSGITIDEGSYVVIITRGHEHDVECLEKIISQRTAYIGLIGSRRRVGFVLEMLAAKGIPRHGLERICTPIGIPIGGESPEEIALSIVAELVCIRRMGLLHTRSLRKNMWD